MILFHRSTWTIIYMRLIYWWIWQGKSAGVCISPGGRFPAFKSEGKPPRKAAKGLRDLTLCRVFRENTCCDVAQTRPAFASMRRLASAGEASQECLDLWEVLECSICHPLVGTKPGPPIMCASFATQFSVLSPCGLNDVMCGRASEWVSNGTELCQLAGFSVQSASFSNHDAEEPFCYGNKASLEAVDGLWKGSGRRSPQKPTSLGMRQDFLRWVRRMTINERLSWAVGLISGLFLLMRRRRLIHRQRQAAVQRTARMLRSRNHPASPNKPT
ncbi:unnamed protein product [Spirodela intermedia]|uniref:Uncharacterized protein n=1 Tax=Spirodela intermedia TaxID=51605 RepID=A0A7I8IBR7_SPIIN|nr:unnamed protein product [Spirodela intermedia]CAA6654311.1 unnamed protein product [Spirodela intermedia]